MGCCRKKKNDLHFCQFFEAAFPRLALPLGGAEKARVVNRRMYDSSLHQRSGSRPANLNFIRFQTDGAHALPASPGQTAP